MPAQATAKSVIASAKRLMLVRQSCRNSRSTALMSVPAWPMPIHHTKLMMGKAQDTGWLLPKTPTPRSNSTLTLTRNTINRAKATKKPTYQRPPSRCSRTMDAMAFVTEPIVWPGSITGGRRVDRGAGSREDDLLIRARLRESSCRGRHRGRRLSAGRRGSGWDW